jgi:hypothetical protein
MTLQINSLARVGLSGGSMMAVGPDQHTRSGFAYSLGVRCFDAPRPPALRV